MYLWAAGIYLQQVDLDHPELPARAPLPEAAPGGVQRWLTGPRTPAPTPADGQTHGAPHGSTDEGFPAAGSRCPSLLESMGRDHLDPGYAEAARHRAAGRSARCPRPGRHTQLRLLCRRGPAWWPGAVRISAGNKQTNEPRAEKARTALLEDIDRAQEKQSELASSAAGLADRPAVNAGRNSVRVGRWRRWPRWRTPGQITPVTGPGLRIVINEAPPAAAAAAAASSWTGTCSCWSTICGRPARRRSAIGGVRLQPRSAIRQAGGSILVDNRPVFWPITIDAIGDPSDLQVKSVGCPVSGGSPPSPSSTTSNSTYPPSRTWPCRAGPAARCCTRRPRPLRHRPLSAPARAVRFRQSSPTPPAPTAGSGATSAASTPAGPASVGGIRIERAGRSRCADRLIGPGHRRTLAWS